ncbi:Cirhin [Dactylella cylindrospora]|nr:Cirhin [Dactylella cylindrospora]
MDIHRCRFVDYIPSKIHAVAFSHPSPYNPQSQRYPASLRLAIGRSNGSIEIWNPTTWFHESTLHGGLNRSIEGLAWIRHSHYSVKGAELLRLFSIGNSTVVTEWDLVTGKPLAHFDCGKGVIWSIAAQPKKAWFDDRLQAGSSKAGEQAADVDIEDTSDGMQLTVGCEDGSLVVITVGSSPGEMTLHKIIPQSKPCRVLSLAYQSPTTVIAGTSDSKLRAFDVSTGRIITTMSVGPKINNKRRNAKKKDTYVWTVKCIPGAGWGGWIIAGDSLGEISLYDGKRYTLRQKIKSHDADVLTIETNANGTQFFSSGVDRVTVKYELVGTGKRATWTEIAKKRFHKHDVRTMASFEAGQFSVLVSGGVDMTPIVIPLRQFGQEYHYTLSALPQQQICATSSSANSRLLLAQFDREVKIWRINTIDEVEAADDVELYGAADEDQGRKLVGGIMVNTDENISSAAVSPSGNLVAISTMATIKLFHLRPRKTTVLLRISKLELPDKIATLGARKVLFSPDGRYLTIIAPNSEPYIFRIISSIDEDGKAKFDFGPLYHLDRKDREPTLSASGKLDLKDGVIALGRGYERTINTALFSPCGRYLVAADLGGWMEVWGLEEGKGKWKLIKAALPRLPASPVAAGFRPLIKGTHSTSEIFFMTANHTLHEFDILTGQLTPWSKRNSDRLPKSFLKNKDRCFGLNVVEEKEKGRRIWCYGHGWVFMVNVDKDLNIPGEKQRKRKEKREQEAREKGLIVAGEESKGIKRKRGIVMTSGAGGEAIGVSRDMMKSTEVTVVGQDREVEGDEDEMKDVDSDEDFLVDKVKNELRGNRGEVEMVHSDSESESSSEEDEEDSESSSNSSDSGSDSGASSDSELSASEHPDKEANSVEGDKMDVDEEGSETKAVAKRGSGPAHWQTFQYRNIMALLPIGDPNEDLEMVVIERPVTDVKLPPAWMPKKDTGRVQKFR